MTQRWYVVQTEPNREPLAADELRAKGLELLYPTELKRRRWPGRLEMIEVEAPIFPGYLMVQLDPDTDDWRLVVRARGVKKLLGDGRKPTPLRDDAAAELVKRFGNGPEIVATPLVPWDRGTVVGISGGALDGRRGVFEGIDAKLPKERVMILLSCFGRQIVVPVPASQVAIA